MEKRKKEAIFMTILVFVLILVVCVIAMYFAKYLDEHGNFMKQPGDSNKIENADSIFNNGCLPDDIDELKNGEHIVPEVPEDTTIAIA